MGGKKIVVLLLFFILLVVVTITGFLIYNSQPSSQSKSSTMCPENEDRFYDFSQVQLGNDILKTLKEGFSFINNFIRTKFNTEYFALSTGIISLDDIKTGRVSLDPTKQYYRGIRNTSSTIAPQKNGGKGCVEYPDVVFKQAPKPVGITSNINGWTYYKNTNFPNAFKLTSLGDISCASNNTTNCLTIQGTTDTDILNSLNAINSTGPFVCNKYNYTQTPYIGENGLLREIRCNKMIPYLQPYGPNYQASISYKNNVLSNQGPCASYNDDSYKLSLDCVKHIWTNLAGCPNVNNDIINYYYNASQNNQMKKVSILYDAQAWASLQTDTHRTACYGTDKTKWPTS